MTATLSASRLPELDKYELLEEIGHGGMATVYRARDHRLGRDVAVKLIHKHLRDNPEVATRFVAEARASAKLRHPGIVDVYDVSGEDAEERYLVVELLRGTTLRKVLQQHRDMPAEIGACIVLELCGALEHAHESGIVHRDVKPENVLVELPADRARACPPVKPRASGRSLASADCEAADGGRVSGASPKAPDANVVIKLTDFGIAKILDAQGVTSTGQVLGSPAHMAPEQIEGGEVDVRTDVFALGVLMYEALVGHLPFEGKNPAQVLRRVLDGSFAPADRERATVGGRWGKIVAGALAHDADARTSSPAELGEQIRAELEALGIADPRAEIRAYFADPKAYADELPGRLVPRLVARAEAARKKGDVPGASADYNRALAFAPTDLAILKRASSLTSKAGRRLFARRAGAVALGSVALGVAAFGIVRFQRSRVEPPEASPVEAPGAPIAPAALDLGPAPEPSAGLPASSAASIDQERPRIRIALPPLVVGSARPPAAQTRNVQFSIIPKGAKLTLDGREVTSWFTKKFQLTPGRHVADVQVTDSSCCKPRRKDFVVAEPEPDRPDAVETVIITLEMLPSKVTLVGAPAAGQCSCTSIALTLFPGAPRSITLPDALWSGRCSFTSPSLAAPVLGTVTLKAGESNDVPWPSG